MLDFLEAYQQLNQLNTLTETYSGASVEKKLKELTKNAGETPVGEILTIIPKGDNIKADRVSISCANCGATREMTAECANDQLKVYGKLLCTRCVKGQVSLFTDKRKLIQNGLILGPAPRSTLANFKGYWPDGRHIAPDEAAFISLLEAIDIDRFKKDLLAVYEDLPDAQRKAVDGAGLLLAKTQGQVFSDTLSLSDIEKFNLFYEYITTHTAITGYNEHDDNSYLYLALSRVMQDLPLHFKELPDYTTARLAIESDTAKAVANRALKRKVSLLELLSTPKIISESQPEIVLRQALQKAFKINNLAIEVKKQKYSSGKQPEFDIYFEYSGKRFAIEYDGPRHNCSRTTVSRDILKSQYCLAHNITLLRVQDFSKPFKVFEDDRVTSAVLAEKVQADNLAGVTHINCESPYSYQNLDFINNVFLKTVSKLISCSDLILSAEDLTDCVQEACLTISTNLFNSPGNRQFIHQKMFKDLSYEQPFLKKAEKLRRLEDIINTAVAEDNAPAKGNKQDRLYVPATFYSEDGQLNKQLLWDTLNNLIYNSFKNSDPRAWLSPRVSESSYQKKLSKSE